MTRAESSDVVARGSGMDGPVSASLALAAAAQTTRTSASWPTRVLASPSRRRLRRGRDACAAMSCAPSSRDRRRCGAAPGRGRGRRRATRPSRSALTGIAVMRTRWGQGRRTTHVRCPVSCFHAARQASSTVPRRASRRGRSSSRSSAYMPADDRQPGRCACALRQLVQLAERVGHATPVGLRPGGGSSRWPSSPNFGIRRRRPSSPSGSAAARSDLHRRGGGGARSPCDQRRPAPRRTHREVPAGRYHRPYAAGDSPTERLDERRRQSPPARSASHPTDPIFCSSNIARGEARL